MPYFTCFQQEQKDGIRRKEALNKKKERDAER